MGAEKCALYRLITSLTVTELSQFNFALMLFNESPESSGYPRRAFFHVTTARRQAGFAGHDYWTRDKRG